MNKFDLVPSIVAFYESPAQRGDTAPGMEETCFSLCSTGALDSEDAFVRRQILASIDIVVRDFDDDEHGYIDVPSGCIINNSEETLFGGESMEFLLDLGVLKIGALYMKNTAGRSA